MSKPICKVAQVTGEVPLECLFECKLNCRVDYLFEDEPIEQELGDISDDIFADFFKDEP
jgi:hypothetical protein